MKISPKPARLMIGCFALLLLLANYATAQTSAPKTQITFAQITDAHLFDDDATSDFSALIWAIAEINRLASAGTQFDFVVYTGDLGLRAVSFPAGRCETAPLASGSASGVLALDQAVERTAEEFNKLSIKKLYFLPGNNDLSGELIGDIGRYRCFLSELQLCLNKKAEGSSSPPLMTAALEPDGNLVAGGIRLLGLNSASLKNRDNYLSWCSEKETSLAACPQIQVDRLSKSLQSGAPSVVFTHIPYLKDPYPPRAQELPSAWDMPQTLRSEWENTACRSNVIAIFAGHFHDSDRDLYGARGRKKLEVTECISNKSWTAPPLAIKFQGEKKEQARGLLVITMTQQEVKECSIHWLDGGISSCR